MIAFTSRLSLKCELPKLQGQRQRVYQAIATAGEPGPCISEIATSTGLKECAVCGRVSELRKLGIIVDGPIKDGPCGKEVKTYIALEWREEQPAPRQPELFQ